MKKSFSQGKKDFLILVALIATTFMAFEAIDVTETFYRFSRSHEAFELDEIVLTAAVSFFYLSVYTIRRYRELKRAYFNSVTDPLVAALNRRGGMQLLERHHSEKRFNTVGSTLILFDIDDFKSVNDIHGHDVGDYVLLTIANICNRQLRSSDTLIRWGGEEFMIVCSNTPYTEAVILAERLRAAIEKYSFAKAGHITASFGLADMDSSLPIKDSISVADRNLYTSKRNGKNQVTGYSYEHKSEL